MAADQTKGRMEAMTVLMKPNTLPLIEQKKETKDPITRLLDLTLGWGEYAEKDEAEHPDVITADDIYSLYQSVARFADPVWDAAPELQEARVRQFVETQLLPLLLGKNER